VDCCVIEVGIGGRTDCTNVLTKPRACGITILDYDHQDILGDTLKEIASHKAGIMKSGVPVVTFDFQRDEPMQQLFSSSIEKESPLILTRDWSEYVEVSPLLQQKDTSIEFSINFLYQNTTIALVLAAIWLDRNIINNLEPILDYKGFGKCYKAPLFPINEKYIQGLKSLNYSGRGQILNLEKYPNVTFYIDGAHTPTSIEHSVQWYESNIPKENVYKILIFNCTKARKPEILFNYILNNLQTPFNHVIFCASKLKKFVDNSSAVVFKITGRITKQLEMEETWKNLCISRKIDLSPSTESIEAMETVLERIEQISIGSSKKLHILITGSLYLVGAILGALEQDTDVF